MTLQVKLRGITCPLEINPKDIAALVLPKQLNAKQAAQFLGISRATFFRRGIPKNRNGKYAVATLEEWVNPYHTGATKP